MIIGEFYLGRQMRGKALYYRKKKMYRNKKGQEGLGLSMWNIHSIRVY